MGSVVMAISDCVVFTVMAHEPRGAPNGGDARLAQTESVRTASSEAFLPPALCQ
jgi:hypothetical protein